MNKTQKNIMSRKNGVSSSIKYYSFDTNSHTETTAIVSYGSFEKLEDNDNIISENATFHLVELPFEPNKRDKIIINDTEWHIETYTPQDNSLFDIYCKKNKRHTAKTRR